MMSTPLESQAVQAVTDLETTVAEVEHHLATLGTALKLQDASAVELAAADLQQALAQAVDRFNQAARTQAGIPPLLRRRLARTSSQVAAQRDAVARANHALDRVLDVLIPSAEPAAVYGTQGTRRGGNGLAQA